MKVDVALGLPLLDPIELLRSESDVTDRLAAVFVAVAVRAGLDSTLGADWILANGHDEGLTDAERAYVLERHAPDQRSATDLPADIEALWCLAWSTGLVPTLSWTDACDDDFVHHFPEVKLGAEAGPLPAALSLRPLEAIIKALDLAYLLHASSVAARLVNSTVDHIVKESAVRGRRLALEWLTSAEDWSEITLDT